MRPRHLAVVLLAAAAAVAGCGDDQLGTLTLSIAPASISVPRGGSGDVAVTFGGTARAGSFDRLALEAADGGAAPAGIGARIVPVVGGTCQSTSAGSKTGPIAADGCPDRSLTLTVEASAVAPAGTHALHYHAALGGADATAPLTVTVVP